MRPASSNPACWPAGFCLPLCRSEQLPLVEQRLAAVGEQLGPAAAASDALQQLRQRIEEECVPALIKPPLAELEAERDGALSTLAAELAGRGLPAVVRRAAQQAWVAQLASLLERQQWLRGQSAADWGSAAASVSIFLRLLHPPLPCSPRCRAPTTCRARCSRRLSKPSGCPRCRHMWTTLISWPTSRAGLESSRAQLLMSARRSRCGAGMSAALGMHVCGCCSLGMHACSFAGASQPLSAWCGSLLLHCCRWGCLQEAAHARERTATEMAAADKEDHEGWHRLLWLRCGEAVCS